MELKDKVDLYVSGIGTASGGIYNTVRVEGVGRIHGDVDCVRCDLSGVSSITGNLKTERLHISGKAAVRGNITAEDINLEGFAKIEGNCEAETFRAKGAFTLDGLLNAGQIGICLHGSASVSEIGGDTIRVERWPGFGLFSFFKKLTANTIEGDHIQLEYTKAKVVRGDRVNIGPGCEIELVEYRTEFTAAKDAKVVESKML